MDDLGDVVGRLSRAIRRAMQRTAGHPALPDAQVELLRLVERRPGIGVKAAAQALRMAPNTVSTLVGDLAGAGLLRRVRPPENRRAVRLALTPEAAARLTAYRTQRRRLLDAALARLDGEGRADVLRATPYLARLAEVIDADQVDQTAADPRVPPRGTAPADARDGAGA
jgi:DNA-binding MarR family transcriptional regulator